MTSVGELLRQERLRQGLDLATIAKATKIASRYLNAIETGEPEHLPGVFFYKSFIRQYADALGMSESALEPMLAQIAEPALPTILPGDKLQFPLKPIDPIVSEGNRKSFTQRRWGWSIAALVVVLVGCSSFYTWWHRIQNQSQMASVTTDVPAVTPAPAKAVPPPPAPTPDPAAQTEAGAPSNGDTAVPPATPPTVSMAQAGDHMVLDVSAKEKTWISIVSDGKTIFSGVLQASETKTLEGHESARIKVGNAAGLEVRLNGRPIGPLGPRGQVRVVQFTKDNFEIMTPSHSL